MRVLVIGGSGRTGQLVIDECLERRYLVTALVRNPATISEKPGLTLVAGTPLDASDIEKAIIATPDDKPQAVIVALASTRRSDNPWAANTSPPRFMADVHSNLISSMKAHSIHKIVTLSALGVGNSWPNLIFLMRWTIMYSKMALAYEDHNLVDQEVKQSGLNFVLVRPSRLTEGVKMPIQSFGDGGLGIGGFSGISRASVAGFLVDAVKMDEWSGKTPVIAN